MKQIIQVDDELKEKIIELEFEIEELCRKLEQQYQPEFTKKNQKLVIELLRRINGKAATNTDSLENSYESFIEIGFEKGEDYFPNTSIPVWKCKSEWFQKIGYLTNKNNMQLEKMILSFIKEMLDEGV